MGARGISREAFEQLVHAHHAAVYRAAARIVGREDARDATQQVFLAVLEGRLRVDEAEDVGRLLRWKAAREALSMARSAASRRKREETRAMDERTSGEEPEALEERALIRRGMDALPDGARAALVLRYVEGLTLAEVGSALQVSTTTAHERVSRALRELQRLLTRAGFAGLAASVESRLADAAPVAVPQGLAQNLLGLKAGALASGVAAAGAATMPALAVAGAAVLLVAASLVAGSVGALRGAGPEEIAFAANPPRVPEAAAAAEEPAPARVAVPADARAREQASGGSSTPLEQVRSGFLSGLAVDPEGKPLEGVSLRASSVERGGKFPRFGVEGRTGWDGRFRLELPVAADEGQPYNLTVVSLGHAEWTSPAVMVRAGEETRVPDVRLSAGGGETPGAWELAVRALDLEGQPVEGALVRVQRRRERGEGLSELVRQETSARTDPQGWTRLRGDILGPKRLVVDARSLGFRLWSEVQDLTVPGALTREVQLAPGLSITGTVRTLYGAPLGELQVYAYDTPSEWLMGTIDDDGRFRITGLEAQSYRVRLHSLQRTWSPVHRVAEAGSVLELVLKRRDDPRDVGDHAAELHGRIVEGASGEPLALAEQAVMARLVPTGSLAEDVAPLMLAGWMGQTAQGFGSPPPPSSDFHLTGIEPGTYMVVVEARGRAPGILGPFVLGPTTVVSDLRVEMSPGATLRGRVLDLDGSPLEGAHVVVLGFGAKSDEGLAGWDAEMRSTQGRGQLYMPSSRTKKDGTFQRGRVPAGMAVRVAALHPEREPVVAEVAPPREGQELEVTLRFERAR